MSRSELFVELDDDPEADQNILLVVNLQQFESQGENVLGKWLQHFCRREPLNHLQHQLSNLLNVELRNVVWTALLEQKIFL